MTQYVGGAAVTIDTGWINVPEGSFGPRLVQTYSLRPEPVIYEFTFSVEKVRQLRLAMYASFFCGLAILFASLLVLSLALQFPYEPSAALLSCSVGTALVFTMKLRDAKG